MQAVFDAIRDALTRWPWLIPALSGLPWLIGGVWKAWVSWHDRAEDVETRREESALSRLDREQTALFERLSRERATLQEDVLAERKYRLEMAESRDRDSRYARQWERVAHDKRHRVENDRFAMLGVARRIRLALDVNAAADALEEALRSLPCNRELPPFDNVDTYFHRKEPPP